MSTWMNDDGLLVKFGASKGASTAGGEFGAFAEGNEHMLEFEVNTTVLDGTGLKFLSDVVTLPKDAYLTRATFAIETAFTSGGSATLAFGLYDTDRTTAYDADGIDSAIAVGSLTSGSITCNGALIGTRLANNTPSLITATVGVAAMTAGKGFLRVYWRP